jgi:RND family efflux transporter MFP subunit
MPDNVDAFSPKTLGRLKIAGIVLACIAAFIVVSGAITRLSADKQAETYADQQSVQTVNVIAPVRVGGSNSLTLPGKLEALYSAPIYARVPGYVRAWYKDIGAQVQKGDLLATIDAPELDQQLEQAKADLANAVAAEKLSQSTSTRWNGLLALDAVSKQEADEKTGDLAAKTALVDAARANVDRLSDLKNFARIVAPFDGTVTSRSVDIGALVNAGAQTSSSALFTVADAHQIRVYVDVPQTYSAEIRPGMTATLSLPQYPGQTFPATLDSTANAFSRQSDTLLVELLANNATGTLKPGEYAQVTFHISSHGNVLRLPASALTFRQQGLQVATVLPDSHVQMKSIVIGRDLGTQVEVSEGLNPQDRIVDNPPDSIKSGDVVRVQASRQSP